MLSYLDIEKLVMPVGMRARGGFYDEKEDRTYVVIGNVGSEIWEPFSEDHDRWKEPHPLDRWTQEKLTPIADKIGAIIVFPFDGPEYAPFQQWAMKSDCVYPSPVGPLIHPHFGLWHAYRAAFVFVGKIRNVPDRHDVTSPCETCVDQPCIHSCPSNAFADNSYDVSACVDHLQSDNLGNCVRKGCIARRSCPVGSEYIYEPVHADFHMNRFVGSDFNQ